MSLLRSLSFFVAHFDIYIIASHLPGVINVTADHLTRGNLHQAFQATLGLATEPTVLPPSVFQLLSPQRVDWMSPHFPQLFKQTLSSVYQQTS